MLINALYVILIIIELKILMEIIMDNAYAKMAIMMIIRIVYANYALFHFGYNILLFINILLSFN